MTQTSIRIAFASRLRNEPNAGFRASPVRCAGAWIGMLVVLGWLVTGAHAAAGTAKTAKVALIAGTKSHGPGAHEYERGMRLVEHCLESSGNVQGVEATVYTDGWPEDPAVLDEADTIVLFCDGSDHRVEDHPLLRGDRLERFQEWMRKGKGFVAIHYAVFVPSKPAGEVFLEDLGGFFDYESGPGPNHWFSKIQTVTAPCTLPAPSHPICRGLEPFDLKEEYYYNIRFRPDDSRRVPILEAKIPGEDEPQVVAWAIEREDGGRGFGYTGGHFHENWANDNVRRMVLNAILWTAHAEVPSGGVSSAVVPADLEIPEAAPAAGAPVQAEKPIRALIITGPQHPAHDWKTTTEALRDVLQADPRFQVEVKEGLETLGQPDLDKTDVVILNTMNHERPGLDAAAQENFLKTVREGTGLAVIHFANGGFRDWPEFRQLARRVWVDGKSGHDPYGPFGVSITDVEHPITKGLKAYDTTDELYFHQQGDLPIEPLVVARSKVTGNEEPLAFAYTLGDGRIFQTLLGHDAASIRNAGTASLIRRGCAWAAKREVVDVAQTSGAGIGRFDRVLDDRALQDEPLLVDSRRDSARVGVRVGAGGRR